MIRLCMMVIFSLGSLVLSEDEPMDYLNVV